MESPETALVSIQVAAARLGLGRHTMRELVRRGRVPAVQVGARQYVVIRRAERLLDEQPEIFSLPEGPTGRRGGEAEAQR